MFYVGGMTEPGGFGQQEGNFLCVNLVRNILEADGQLIALYIMRRASREKHDYTVYVYASNVLGIFGAD